MRVDLNKIAKEIREIILRRQEELSLTFIEETHTYYMKDLNGEIRSDWPSVSKVHEEFYDPFNAEEKALQMCRGDVDAQQILLAEWALKGELACNKGSRVHFELEKEAVRQYGNYKDVRKPIFTCSEQQIYDGDKMIRAGKNYLDLIHERGGVLIDTEAVLGSNTLGYVGTPDKAWLIMNKQKTNFGLLITDWKSNEPKNFVTMPYHGKLYPPFEQYDATTLGHYQVQLPLYGRLFIDMLRGSKYADLQLLGCVIVLLKDNGTYEEFRVPQPIMSGIMTMDLSKYVKHS